LLYTVRHYLQATNCSEPTNRVLTQAQYSLNTQTLTPTRCAPRRTPAQSPRVTTCAPAAPHTLTPTRCAPRRAPAQSPRVTTCAPAAPHPPPALPPRIEAEAPPSACRITGWSWCLAHIVSRKGGRGGGGALSGTGCGGSACSEGGVQLRGAPWRFSAFKGCPKSPARCWLRCHQA